MLKHVAVNVCCVLFDEVHLLGTVLTITYKFPVGKLSR